MNSISLIDNSINGDHVKNLENLEGNYNQIGMWRLKNKLISKELCFPIGKLDESGNLITAPSALKKLYLDHYAARLKHRKIKEN